MNQDTSPVSLNDILAAFENGTISDIRTGMGVVDRRSEAKAAIHAYIERLVVKAKPERERATGDLDSDYVHGKHEGWNSGIDEYEQAIKTVLRSQVKVDKEGRL